MEHTQETKQDMRAICDWTSAWGSNFKVSMMQKTMSKSKTLIIYQNMDICSIHMNIHIWMMNISVYLKLGQYFNLKNLVKIMAIKSLYMNTVF